MMDMMAKHDNLPKVLDEIHDLRCAEQMLQRSAPSLEEAAKAQRARAGRIDHWMQSSIGYRRHWWQFWRG
jgi:hypothetical protein